MTISLQIPDELARQADLRGLDIAQYIDQILQAAAKPVLPRLPRFNPGGVRRRIGRPRSVLRHGDRRHSPSYTYLLDGRE